MNIHLLFRHETKIALSNDAFLAEIGYTLIYTNSDSIMFEILDITKNNVIAFKATGKVEEADYEKIIPLMEKTEREGNQVSLFIEIGEIKGITGKALLKDIVTYFKHIKHIKKVAVVGRNGAGKGWAEIADPFVKAEIRYFPVEEKVVAEEWIAK